VIEVQSTFFFGRFSIPKHGGGTDLQLLGRAKHDARRSFADSPGKYVES